MASHSSLFAEGGAMYSEKRDARACLEKEARKDADIRSNCGTTISRQIEYPDNRVISYVLSYLRHLRADDFEPIPETPLTAKNLNQFIMSNKTQKNSTGEKILRNTSCSAYQNKDCKAEIERAELVQDLKDRAKENRDNDFSKYANYINARMAQQMNKANQVQIDSKKKKGNPNHTEKTDTIKMSHHNVSQADVSRINETLIVRNPPSNLKPANFTTKIVDHGILNLNSYSKKEKLNCIPSQFAQKDQNVDTENRQLAQPKASITPSKLNSSAAHELQKIKAGYFEPVNNLPNKNVDSINGAKNPTECEIKDGTNTADILSYIRKRRSTMMQQLQVRINNYNSLVVNESAKKASLGTEGMVKKSTNNYSGRFNTEPPTPITPIQNMRLEQPKSGGKLLGVINISTPEYEGGRERRHLSEYRSGPSGGNSHNLTTPAVDTCLPWSPSLGQSQAVTARDNFSTPSFKLRNSEGKYGNNEVISGSSYRNLGSSCHPQGNIETSVATSSPREKFYCQCAAHVHNNPISDEEYRARFEGYKNMNVAINYKYDASISQYEKKPLQEKEQYQTFSALDSRCPDVHNEDSSKNNSPCLQSNCSCDIHDDGKNADYKDPSADVSIQNMLEKNNYTDLGNDYGAENDEYQQIEDSWGLHRPKNSDSSLSSLSNCTSRD